MRVAFVIEGFGTLTETFIVNQMQGVIARGHDVDILACGAPSDVTLQAAVGNEDLRACVRNLMVPSSLCQRARHITATIREHHRAAPALCRRAFNLFRYGRMAATGRLYCSAVPFMKGGVGRYDVIHCQFGPLGVWALRLRQIGAIQGALVTAFRGYDATQYLKSHPRAYRSLFAEGDTFLPVSAALANALARHNCPADRIEVHHSGIDVERFPFRPRTRKADEPVRLITVARLVEKKGVRYAIDAVAQLLQNGMPITYDIVGDGPERARLGAQITTRGLGRHVRLLGCRQPDEVRALLDGSHVLVAPSVTAADGDQEGIPNTIKEAMALGMPVVATEHGGNAELVQHAISGFLVPERDVAALCRQIADLVAIAERWPEMGLAGRRMVEAEFDIAVLSRQLDDVYRRTIERYRKRSGTRSTRWVRAVSEVR